MIFKICKGLGIDDPCFWMNSVSPLVIDQWIAFELCELEESTTDMMSPEEALTKLTQQHA